MGGDGRHANRLGEFLRARRALVTPEQVGLPDARRRRVAGLRREELAPLAGVSVDYYVRLEQGRDPHTSRAGPRRARARPAPGRRCRCAPARPRAAGVAPPPPARPPRARASRRPAAARELVVDPGLRARPAQGRPRVQRARRAPPRLVYPLVGEIVLGYDTLRVADAPEQLAVGYHAGPGSASERALALLQTMAAERAVARVVATA